MKIRFKKLFAVALIASAFTISAHAGYDSDTVTLQTNACTASAAAFEYAKIPCGGQKDVAVHIEFNMSAADTSAQTFYFTRSVTGSTNDIETLVSRWQPVGIAATGTTRSLTITNIPTYGAGTIVFCYSTNAAASAYRTNLIVKKAEKTMAP